jgi:predicted metalloendopeptidase
MPAPQVNAYYDPSLNSMNYPSGIVQPPFFAAHFPVSAAAALSQQRSNKEHSVRTGQLMRCCFARLCAHGCQPAWNYGALGAVMGHEVS